MERFDRDELHDLLRQVKVSHENQCKALTDEHCKNMEKWLFQIRQGYNLIYYGLGSKITLLKAIQNRLSERYPVLVVNGFFPSITLKQILTPIYEDILKIEGSFSRPEEQIMEIVEALETSKTDMCIIVHNVDGAMMRNEKIQYALSVLAQCPYVHVVASVDNINSPLLWDNVKMRHFNWLWHRVPTFEPYVKETSYENSLLVQNAGSLALSSLVHVFNSLTSNARKIFVLIAEFQLKHAVSSYEGMGFKECYKKCRQAFVVNNEHSLKAQLTEFTDHKLLKVKKGADGGDYIFILLDQSTLQEFIDQQQQS